MDKPLTPLQTFDLKGKKVLIRVDFNVPFDPSGAISDDTRLKAALPTIEYVLNHGASAILMSHLGRPKGIDPKYSLKPCALALAHLLKKPVQMAEDCIGEKTQEMAKNLQSGQVLLLENLRFYKAEEDPASDTSFAQKLASLADLYVDDAFSAAHRDHSSITTITSFFPGKCFAGLLLQKEIQFLGSLIKNPKEPFYAIIGGAKISTKMGVLKSLIPKIRKIFIGGGMAFTFYKAQGLKIGSSIYEEDQIPVALDFLNTCKKNQVSCYLPTDLIIADSFKGEAKTKTILASDGIADNWQGMDIGPNTITTWKKELKDAGTVFWNGPLGVFEFSQFAKGTEEIAKTLADLDAITVVGGGDSIAAINKLRMGGRFSHLSTGGGASLEYIEFGHLPGIDALIKNGKS